MLTLDSWRLPFQFRLPSTRLLARTLYAAGLLLGLLISGAQADGLEEHTGIPTGRSLSITSVAADSRTSFADRAVGGLATIRFVFYLRRKALR